MTGRRWCSTALAICAALALAPAAGAQIPTQDSATGSGDTETFYQDLDFDLTSGPSGENPTGHSLFFFQFFPGGGLTQFSTSAPACVHVEGNTVTAAAPLDPNPFGLVYGKLTAVDNGPADSGLDTFATIGSASQPFDCSTPTANLQDHLIRGDIVVVDAPPLPTTLAQCMKGGWSSYGVFNNEGDCVSFVATGGKNPPAG